MTDNITKIIKVKVPYVFIWTLAGVAILLGNTVPWWSRMLSDLMFGIALIAFTTTAIFIFYLFYKYYSRKSLKQLIIEDDDIVLTYQMLRQRNPASYEYRTIRQSISLIVKGNILNLWEHGKPIARIYRGTLRNKSDWEWLIHYFEN